MPRAGGVFLKMRAAKERYECRAAAASHESERTSFAVDIPEAKARIESGDFWVSSNASGAKFTNYDDRPVAVAASGETVVLGRNEGLVLSAKGKAGEKRDVLGAPRLSAPANDGVAYNSAADLAWAGPEGAGGYWLEIGADQSFDTMLVSEFGLQKPAFRAEQLPPGEYYWRVSALDAFGLPGRAQRPLALHRGDRQGRALPEDRRAGRGRDRARCRDRDPRRDGAGGCRLGERPSGRGDAPSGGSLGRWRPARGKTASRSSRPTPPAMSRELLRSFSYMADRSEAVVLDASIPRDPAGRILAGGDVVSLAGSTKPDSRIDVVGADGALRGSAASDPAGRFALNIALGADEESLSIVVTAPSGFRTAQKLDIVVDRERPTITLSEELPRLTASETCSSKGRSPRPARRSSSTAARSC